MIEVELPDGTIAEFPEGTPPDTIKGALGKRFGRQPGTMEDVAKSGASGFARGVADLAGLPGTIGDAFNSGMSWLTGLPPLPENPIGGSSLRRAASTVSGGATDYQPQTTAGEYARTVGEFAPSAAAGPGNVMRKIAMATVPAIASETAGQATKGTAAEPWARGLTALAAGVGTAGIGSTSRAAVKQGVNELAPTAPTREALKATTDNLYSQMRNAGIRYDANAFGQTVQSMSADLLKQGFRPSVAREAFSLIDDLRQNVGQSPDFDDINGLVQMVGQAARDASRTGNNTLAKAFGTIRDKLDDFEAGAPFISNGSMNQTQLTQVRQLARKSALQNIKARALDDIVTNADTYQSGVEAGIRNGISNMIRSKKGQQLFSGPERTALLEVAQGRKGLRTLSRFGFDVERLSGNASFLPTAGAGGLALAGEPILGAGLAAVGTAAKVASPRLTQRAFDRTAAAIRTGQLPKAGGAGAARQLMNDRILRDLLSGNMAITGSGVTK